MKLVNDLIRLIDENPEDCIPIKDNHYSKGPMFTGLRIGNYQLENYGNSLYPLALTQITDTGVGRIVHRTKLPVNLIDRIRLRYCISRWIKSVPITSLTCMVRKDESIPLDNDEPAVVSCSKLETAYATE